MDFSYIKGQLACDLCFVYAMEIFLTLTWKCLYKHIKPYFNMPAYIVSIQREVVTTCRDPC